MRWCYRQAGASRPLADGYNGRVDECWRKCRLRGCRSQRIGDLHRSRYFCKRRSGNLGEIEDVGSLYRNSRLPLIRIEPPDVAQCQTCPSFYRAHSSFELRSPHRDEHLQADEGARHLCCTLCDFGQVRSIRARRMKDVGKRAETGRRQRNKAGLYFGVRIICDDARCSNGCRSNRRRDL